MNPPVSLFFINHEPTQELYLNDLMDDLMATANDHEPTQELYLNKRSY